MDARNETLVRKAVDEIRAAAFVEGAQAAVGAFRRGIAEGKETMEALNVSDAYVDGILTALTAMEGVCDVVELTVKFHASDGDDG